MSVAHPNLAGTYRGHVQVPDSPVDWGEIQLIIDNNLSAELYIATGAGILESGPLGTLRPLTAAELTTLYQGGRVPEGVTGFALGESGISLVLLPESPQSPDGIRACLDGLSFEGVGSFASLYMPDQLPAESGLFDLVIQHYEGEWGEPGGFPLLETGGHPRRTKATRTLRARVIGKEENPHHLWGVECTLTIPADTPLGYESRIIIESPAGSLACTQRNQYQGGPDGMIVLRAINPALDAAMAVLTISPQVADLVAVSGVVIVPAPAQPSGSFTYERWVGGSLVQHQTHPF